MLMTLLYVVAIAVVVVIVAIAVLYAVVFLIATVGLLFGFKVAWKKRKFFSGLIPDEEVSVEGFAAGIVRGSVAGAREAIQKSRSPKELIEVEQEPSKRILPRRTGEKTRRRRPPQKLSDENGE